MVAELQVPSPKTIEHEQLMTANDLLEISARDENRYELIKGRLIVMSPAGFEHGSTVSKLNAQVQVFVEENDLGVATAAETGFYLERNPDTVRAPDVGFVSKKKLPDGPLPRSYFEGCPDLAVEVVSPNDRVSDVQDKVQVWLSHGAKLVWVVEPKTQTVTIYRADGSAQVLQSTDTLEGEEVLPGFQYPLEKLFRYP